MDLGGKPRFKTKFLTACLSVQKKKISSVSHFFWKALLWTQTEKATCSRQLDWKSRNNSLIFFNLVCNEHATPNFGLCASFKHNYLWLSFLLNVMNYHLLNFFKFNELIFSIKAKKQKMKLKEENETLLTLICHRRTWFFKGDPCTCKSLTLSKMCFVDSKVKCA